MFNVGDKVRVVDYRHLMDGDPNGMVGTILNSDGGGLWWVDLGISPATMEPGDNWLFTEDEIEPIGTAE